MLKSVKDVFFKAGILYQKRIELKKTIKNQIKKNKQLLNVLNNLLKLDDVVLNLLKLCKNNDEEFKIYHEIIKEKLSLQQNFTFLDGQKDKFLNTTKSYLQMFITIIDNCYDSIVSGGNIEEELKILYMKVYFIQKELISSLNQL